MPPLPPLKDTLEALQQCVLPGAGGAALVAALFLCLGRWAGATGSALAVAVAYMAANFTLARLGPDDPLPTWENTSRLLLWKVEAGSPGYQWFPRIALVLLVVGLVSRWVGLVAGRVLPARVWWGANALVWLPRAYWVFAASAWLVAGPAAAKPEWATLRWELAGAMLLLWFVLDGLARGGTGTEVAAYLAATFYAGSVVLLYAHTGKFMELAVVFGSALFGIAAVCGASRARADVSGAIPAAVVFLPGLLLGGRPSLADNKVPAICFWLIALAPVVLAPFLIPRVSRQNRWALLVLRALLVLAPLVVAVVLAGQHEKFPFEEEPEW